MITADHGEEFDHGVFGHARLHSETARYPYLTNAPNLVPDTDAIRHVDFAPTILNHVKVDTPFLREKYIANYEKTPLQPMWNLAPRLDRKLFGVHDSIRKFVRSYDTDGSFISKERYNCNEDPNEQSPVEQLPDDESLRDELDASQRRFDSVSDDARTAAGIDENVADRLRELGYR